MYSIEHVTEIVNSIPFLKAIKDGDVPELQKIIRLGIDVNAKIPVVRDENSIWLSLLPLKLAFTMGRHPVVDELLFAGADLKLVFEDYAFFNDMLASLKWPSKKDRGYFFRIRSLYFCLKDFYNQTLYKRIVECLDKIKIYDKEFKEILLARGFSEDDYNAVVGLNFGVFYEDKKRKILNLFVVVFDQMIKQGFFPSFRFI